MELAGWYQHSDVFVMPSYYETFGISAAEALAFGTPVVAFKVVGLSEVVQDGQTGILVDSGDVTGLDPSTAGLLKRLV